MSWAEFWAVMLALAMVTAGCGVAFGWPFAMIAFGGAVLFWMLIKQIVQAN